MECLLPKAKMSLDQALCSVKRHRNTVLRGVIKTLNNLVYQITYMDSFFIGGKGKKWVESQSTIIPFSIKDNIPTICITKNAILQNKKSKIKQKNIDISLKQTLRN